MTRRRFIKIKYFKGLTTAMYRSRTRVHIFVTDASMKNHLTKCVPSADSSSSGWVSLWSSLEKNNDGTAVTPTQKSATANETTNALVLVRSCRLLKTRKMIKPFPVMVSTERKQPRIQNQISIFWSEDISWSFWSRLRHKLVEKLLISKFCKKQYSLKTPARPPVSITTYFLDINAQSVIWLWLYYTYIN